MTCRQFGKATCRTARTFLVVLALWVVPVAASAEGIRVTSILGPVEVVSAGGPALVWVDANAADGLPELDVGDRVRTGPAGQVTLELPDGSYVVVGENTTFEVEEYRGSGLRDLMRVMLGTVRFHIQKLGGRPNPYRVNTPTALIAVRGTEFDVRVDAAAQTTEIRTYEGRVKVETAGEADREVVLDPGFKTLVRAGQNPLRPVGLEEEFGPSRALRVVRTEPAGDDADGKPVAAGRLPIPGAIGGDNDRRNRRPDPLGNPNLDRSTPSVLRGKLSFP